MPETDASFLWDEQAELSDPVELDGEPMELTEDDEAQAPASPGRRRALLIGIGVAAVLCAASAVAFGPRVYHVAAEQGTTVDPPPQIGELRRDTSTNAQSTADYIRSAVAGAAGLDKSVGDVYSTPTGADNSIIFAGGTTTIWTPSNSLKDVLATVSDDNGGVSSLQTVATGTFGGVARCGVTKTDGADMPVCAWADYASVGIVLFPNRTAADAQNLFATMRPAIERRG
jgi:hypothetical protein